MFKVKVCGITNLDDAILACDCGADALGFVFYDKSPRFITPEAAEKIVAQLPPFVSKVGVFVNTPAETVSEICRHSRLAIAQLHGDETTKYCNNLSIDYIKAFRVSDSFRADSVLEYGGPAYLLDAYHRDQYGGTGLTFNWDLALQVKSHGRIILSGGINSDNVEEAVTRVQPDAIDVGSGVESSPGRKDRRKLTVFMQQVAELKGKSNT